MTGLKSYLTIGAALVAVVAGSYLSAGAAAAPRGQGTQPTAQSNDPHPTRFVGKVASVGASSVVLETRNGTITANVGPNTWIVVDKSGKAEQGTLSDIQVDKPAMVAGMTTSDTKVVDARTVAQGAKVGAVLGGKAGKERARGRMAGKMDHHALAGTVKAISGDTVTVSTERGKDVDVVANAGTVVLNNGFSSLSSLKTGDKVQVLGGPQGKAKDAGSTPAPGAANRQLNALAIRVVTAGSELKLGRVESVSGNTVTLRTPKNRDGLAVTLTTATVYKQLSVSAVDKTVTLSNASQSDVQAAGNLVVEGVQSADGKTFTATAVIILPSRGERQPKQ